MRFFVKFLLLLCLFDTTAAADPLFLEMEFAPASGNFSPDLADDLDFRAYEPDTPLDTGVGDSGVVLRVRVPPETGFGTSRNLILRPHYLWHVTGWFKYQDRQQWTRTVVGRLLPPTATYYSTKD